jgi:hypothetical protein
MNSRFTTLLVIAMTFALVACGGDEKTTGAGTDTGPEAPPETASEVAPEVAPETAGDTPQSTFDRIKSAVANKDFSAFYDFLSADTRGWIDGKITQARQMIKTAEGTVPGAVDLAKGQLGDKFGFSYDDLMNKPARDVGGLLIAKTFGGKIPGVLAGEVEGEPKGDADAVKLSVKKPNGSIRDLDMVKEDDAWKLKWDF